MIIIALNVPCQLFLIILPEVADESVARGLGRGGDGAAEGLEEPWES